ncbi:MAG TPA: hypothetical protein VF798_03185 [Burkholderiaceae bacterium]
MAVVEIVLNERDNSRLQAEYSKMCEAWSRPGQHRLPPTFEQWLGTRAVEAESRAAPAEVDDARLFDILERLVTSLPQHGFSLAHVGKQGISREEAAKNLAQLLVRDFHLSGQYAKRIEELFAHYAKDAREVADLAQLTITNLTFGALNEAYRQLAERTETALARLGPDRAIGRVEGGAAILVEMKALGRESAHEKTNAFKVMARSHPRAKWVDKIFKSGDVDE